MAYAAGSESNQPDDKVEYVIESDSDEAAFPSKEPKEFLVNLFKRAPNGDKHEKDDTTTKTTKKTTTTKKKTTTTTTEKKTPETVPMSDRICGWSTNKPSAAWVCGSTQTCLTSNGYVGCAKKGSITDAGSKCLDYDDYKAGKCSDPGPGKRCWYVYHLQIPPVTASR